MPNYLNGKVYAIRSHQTEQVYIGSTVERLSARMGKYRALYNKYKDGEGCYYSCFKILDHADAYIELLAKHECLCREELDQYKGDYIRSEPNAVNKIRDEDTEQLRERKKKYREDNAEKIKAREKLYYQANREKIKQQVRIYKQNNVEKIRDYESKKITCPCGGVFRTQGLAKHNRSKMHQAYETYKANKELETAR
jgi:hypothetical protein